MSRAWVEGKTWQALAVLQATDAFPAVVVAPAVAKINWVNEARGLLEGRTVAYVDGTTPYPVDADIVVVNWDVLAEWLPTFKGYAAAVFDEIHMAKNGQALRTKTAIRLSTKVIDPMAVRLGLTGTAFVNVVDDVWAQILILRREQDFGGTKAEFKRRYKGRTGALLLNKALRKTCFIRRLKVDVLPDLPDKRWETFTVEGDPAVMVEYREAEAKFIAYLKALAEKAALESGATTAEAKRAAMLRAFKAERAEHLVRISNLRQLSARAKVPALREWMGVFEQSGKKVITFAWHRPIVDMFASEFADGLKIQGGMTAVQRQAAVDRFQTDDSARVIACNITAAGVAITLTAASDVLFAESGWTPKDMDQAIDRAHRIGQTDSVTGWLPQIEDSIDQDMAEIIARKRVLVNAAADGVDVEADEGSMALELAMRLAGKAVAAAA
jgi:SWI/SNF-related matrix-associated actin-dependent regulator of chromatin subfamily A-like protein 1